MFGKVFGSMFEGSLVGKGAMVFAVMSYAIAKAQPAKDRMQVTLNPVIISAAIGEPVADVREAIEFLCSPDPDSTSKEEGGRRLVQVGSFEYWLVNGMKYRAIRDEEQRREQLREAQARYRAKHGVKKGRPLPGQIAHEKMVEEGASEGELDRHADSLLPEARRHSED